VCQVRTAAAALVQSWWKDKDPIDRALQKIHFDQANLAAARKSHTKRTLRRLRNIGVHLDSVERCLWDTGL
jgi:hypothetical protein